MKLRKFITKSGRRAISSKRFCFPFVFFFPKSDLPLRASFLLLIIHNLLFAQPAQRIAVLVPEKLSPSRSFAAKLESSLRTKFDVLDGSLSETAFRSTVYENPFNLSIEESKNIGAAIGCRYFLLIKSETQRRSAFQREEFYESFAAVYVVSAKTGKLVFWKLQSFEALKPSESEKLLLDSTDALALEIAGKLKIKTKEETIEKLNEKTAGKIEEVPDESDPEAKNFRPPLPYKRFKPEYTRLAYIYDIKATVDVSVDLDETGAILQTEIVRWAGYGLDESVIETVRRMNWRPATLNGKTLPMRVLLRYNFKKIEKEEQ